MISAATRRPTWNGMSGSAALPCPVTRAGGGQGWPYCSTAVSRPGWWPGGRCRLRHHRPVRHDGTRCHRTVPRTAWCRPWPAWHSARWPEGETR